MKKYEAVPKIYFKEKTNVYQNRSVTTAPVNPKKFLD